MWGWEVGACGGGCAIELLNTSNVCIYGNGRGRGWQINMPMLLYSDLNGPNGVSHNEKNYVPAKLSRLTIAYPPISHLPSPLFPPIPYLKDRHLNPIPYKPQRRSLRPLHNFLKLLPTKSPPSTPLLILCLQHLHERQLFQPFERRRRMRS